MGALFNVVYGAEFVDHDDELVSTQACHGVGPVHGGLQAPRHRCEEDVAVGMAERVVDLLEVVDVHKEDRNLLTIALGAEDSLAEKIVK